MFIKDLFTWVYGASYIFIIGLFVCTIVVLLLLDLPMTEAQTSDHLPPRTIFQLLSIPHFLLALITATIAFRFSSLSFFFPLFLKEFFNQISV